MKFKKTLCGLLSLLMCFGCFLNNIRAYEYTPEDLGGNVIKLSSGKSYSDKNVILYDNMYSFTMSKDGVIAISVTLEDKEFKDEDCSYLFNSCYGRILAKNTWLNTTFVNDQLSYGGWTYSDGKAKYNAVHYLNKGTYYIDLGSTIEDKKISKLNIKVTKKDLSNYKLKTTKFKIMNVPNRSSSYSTVIKYVDNKALPEMHMDYFEGQNGGYKLEGMTLYNKTTKKWLYLDGEKFSWSKTKKTQVDSIPYGDICKDKAIKEGSDIVIYTKWTPKKYKVTYHKNGATGTMKSSTFTYDKKGTLKANTFKHKTKKFTGWKAKTNVYGYTMWYYTNGKKSGWYYENNQPSGWKKKVFKDTANIKNLVYDYYELFDVDLYAVWR